MELTLEINEIDKSKKLKNETENGRLERGKDQLKANEESKKEEEKEWLEERKEEVRSLYKRQFHPVEYMRQYYAEIDPEEGFFLTQLHQFFHEKQESAKKIGPRIVLEVGSGPLISGPAYCIKA